MKWFRRVLKWLRWTLLSVVGVVVVTLALVSAILATESGSRWVLNQVAERLPLTFEGMSGDLITGLDVQSVEYRLENQWYRVENLSFRWQPLSLLYSAVSVQSLRASAVELHLPPPSEEEEPASASESIEWPDISLPVRIELGGVDLRNIRIYQGETETPLERVSGTASLGTFNLRVWDLTVAAPSYGATANGRIGVSYPYDAKLALKWHYRLSPPEGGEIEFRGEGNLEGDLTSLTAEHTLQSPVTIESDLRFWPNLSDPEAEPKLVMDSRWPEQALPAAVGLPETLADLRTSGRLQVEGWLSGYQVDTTVRASGSGIPALELDLAGEGDLKQLNLEPLTLVLPEGDLQARGRLAWAPKLQWDLALSLNQLNPAALPWAALESWPGSIGGQFTSEGKMTPEGLQAGVSELDIAGQLRSLALSLTGHLDYDGERLQAQALELALGANRLTLNGTVSDQLDIDAQLSAPVLSQLDPALEGELTADIQLTGPLSEPGGRVSVEGVGLSWQDRYRLEQLTISAVRRGQRYQVALAAVDINVPGDQLQSFAVIGEGGIDDHVINATLVSENWGQANWRLAGGYTGSAWDGALTNLKLEPPDLLFWELDREAPLTVAADEVVVRSLCLSPAPRWRQEEDGSRRQGPAEGRICVDGQWLAQGGASAVALVEGLPLRLAHRWLTPEVVVEGTLEGRLELLAPPQAQPNAQWHLETRNGALRYQFGEDDAEVFEWQGTRFEGTLKEGQIDARLRSDWGDKVGSLQATLGVNTGSGALEGQLQADFHALEPLEALVAQLQDVRGQFTADLKVSGTIKKPDVSGELRLSEATAKLPELGLQLQHLNLQAQTANNEVNLQGQVTSGEGQLTLDGQVDQPWSADRQISVTLTGKDFQVLNTRELMVLVTPDLTLEVTPERIDLTGTAVIPKARAEFKSLPQSATRVSDDVVLKDPEGGGGEQAGRTVHVDLKTSLGDDVRFSGFGLQSRLSGELQVIKGPERGLLVLGEVGVAEGRYEAYGQNLKIERGRLIFQGPYDNPGLDIRATRTIEDGVDSDIVVGLQISGTLQRPRSEIFSNPSLPDSEAMAMLFTGKSLNSSSSADASMLVNAIGGLGLKRSGFITAEIADTFNLDEFRIQTEDNVQESSLYIGKYLTPDLFVQYVVGLFDQTSSVGLRYEITESLRLEAESGLHQSVDLIYNIER
ncbi:translocation/assembly module TamB domain-containing protein [Marinimicrobium agarilyticum]|uniref:translocation/assembly module TamB domain-containing protein n=1 Tax=Marinimicrobium agarilyticum TaxID=306546 RepID=UPI00040BEF4F|nr:translocation/assembly module TamB domain-containing protein [Marinimicrobium agarilyticum]